jgi:hypothetical protein
LLLAMGGKQVKENIILVDMKILGVRVGSRRTFVSKLPYSYRPRSIDERERESESYDYPDARSLKL